MKSKKALVGLAVFALILTAGIASAYAYQGDYTQKGPSYSAERHEAMQVAFDNNDYNAWKEQMTGHGRVTEVINEDNFAQFAKAHKLADEGKYEEADTIRAELGLRTKDGVRMGKGFGRGARDGSHMNRSVGGHGDHSGFVDANGDGSCDNLEQ